MATTPTPDTENKQEDTLSDISEAEGAATATADQTSGPDAAPDQGTADAMDSASDAEKQSADAHMAPKVDEQAPSAAQPESVGTPDEQESDATAAPADDAAISDAEAPEDITVSTAKPSQPDDEGAVTPELMADEADTAPTVAAGNEAEAAQQVDAVAEEPAAAQTEVADKESEPSPAPADDSLSPTASAETAGQDTTENNAPTPGGDVAATLARLAEEVEKLSIKNATRLNTARTTLNGIREGLSEAQEDIMDAVRELQGKLEEKLEKNRAHQDALRQSTQALLANLKLALEEGRSDDALPAWDRIQGNISNTGGKIRDELQSLANEFKAKLNELRDWKIFASTERKKGIIQQMEKLIESKMHAADRSRHITAMHKEWKELGRSNQNEELWRQFKQLSDKAYEPCKEYFKQRKQLMANNLKKRREICDELETQLGALDHENINISGVNQVISEAEKDWKQHAPVEQSKIKSIQKRFYGIINRLRQMRKQALRDNGRMKQELIDKAQELAKLEDKQQAMSEAKRLQQDWKTIGPTSFKEDKKYWEAFRQACDALFAERNQAAAEQKSALKQAEQELQGILGKMESLLTLNDEDYRKARGDYKDLMQSFSNTLSPALRRSSKRLTEQFNGLKRKLDGRYKSLPDRKQVALLDAVAQKVDILSQAEDALFAAAGGAFDESRKALDADAWQALAPTGNSACDKTLDWRYQQLQQAADPADLLRRAAECADTLRTLCVELEIRAGIESPEQDQALRMQIQLDQLKKGFGQNKTSAQEDTRHAQEAGIHSRCFGPLEPETRQELSGRIEAALKRLL